MTTLVIGRAHDPPFLRLSESAREVLAPPFTLPAAGDGQSGRRTPHHVDHSAKPLTPSIQLPAWCRPTLVLTGRRDAKRRGNPTASGATLLGAPVQRVVGRPLHWPKRRGNELERSHPQDNLALGPLDPAPSRQRALAERTRGPDPRQAPERTGLVSAKM